MKTTTTKIGTYLREENKKQNNANDRAHIEDDGKDKHEDVPTLVVILLSPADPEAKQIKGSIKHVLPFNEKFNYALKKHNNII